jgi:hypothetical protein
LNRFNEIVTRLNGVQVHEDLVFIAETALQPVMQRLAYATLSSRRQLMKMLAMALSADNRSVV